MKNYNNYITESNDNIYYIISRIEEPQDKIYYGIVYNNEIIDSDYYLSNWISIEIHTENEFNNIMIDYNMILWQIIYKTDSEENAKKYIDKQKQTKKFKI